MEALLSLSVCLMPMMCNVDERERIGEYEVAGEGLDDDEQELTQPCGGGEDDTNAAVRLYACGTWTGGDTNTKAPLSNLPSSYACGGRQRNDSDTEESCEEDPRRRKTAGELLEATELAGPREARRLCEEASEMAAKRLLETEVKEILEGLDAVGARLTTARASREAEAVYVLLADWYDGRIGGGRFKDAASLARSWTNAGRAAELSDSPERTSRTTPKSGGEEKGGSLVRAEAHYRKALEIYETEYGPEDATCASAAGRLANVVFKRGDLESATELYERVVEIRQQTHPSDHPDVATALNNLALSLKSRGKLSAALPLYERALKIRSDILPADHDDVVTSLRNLAFLHLERQEPEQALIYWRRVVEIGEIKYAGFCAERENVLAPDLRQLALCYCECSDLESARPVLERVVELRWRAFGSNTLAVADDLNDLANVLCELGEPRRAEPYYRRALEVKKRHYGERAPAFAVALGNLGACLRDLGDFKQAETLFRRSLAVHARCDPSSLDVAADLENLAHLLALGWIAAGAAGGATTGQENDDEENACPGGTVYCTPPKKKTSLGLPPALGADPSSSSSSRSLDAAHYWNRALAIRTHALGPTHPDTVRTKAHFQAALDAAQSDKHADENTALKKPVFSRNQGFASLTPPCTTPVGTPANTQKNPPVVTLSPLDRSSIAPMDAVHEPPFNRLPGLLPARSPRLGPRALSGRAGTPPTQVRRWGRQFRKASRSSSLTFSDPGDDIDLDHCLSPVQGPSLAQEKSPVSAVV